MNDQPSAGTFAIDAQRWAAERLLAAGCWDPQGEAALLVRSVTGPGSAPTDGRLSCESADALGERVIRRAAREPLGYVLGRTTFRELDIAVDERVFVPRSETELLVEAAHGIPPRARVLEPCTGSGAVALALKRERPDLCVTGSDRSAKALEVARINAARLGIDVTFVQADGIAAAPHGPFDAVVSNPPYVAETEAGTGSLPPETENHEPPRAFWAGPDGLAIYRRFATELGGVRWVAFEVGDSQVDDVAEMLSDAEFDRFGRKRVASGHVRVLIAERTP